MKKFTHILTKSYDQQALFLFVVCMLLVSLIMIRPPADNDMWWHLGAGRAMWENGEILTTDIFSYTRAGQPWTNAFWIPEILMYLVQHLGGFFGLTLSVSFMAVLTLSVVYKHSRSPLPIRLTVTVLAALVMIPIWSARTPSCSTAKLLKIARQTLNPRYRKKLATAKTRNSFPVSFT